LNNKNNTGEILTATKKNCDLYIKVNVHLNNKRLSRKVEIILDIGLCSDV